MSDENPTPEQHTEPTNSTTTPEAVAKVVKTTAEVVAKAVTNAYEDLDIKSSDIRPTQVVGALLGIGLTFTVSYWAGKKGVKTGMKSYILTGQSLVESASSYAESASHCVDAALHYSEAAKLDAEACRIGTQELLAATKTTAKAIKKVR